MPPATAHTSYGQVIEYIQGKCITSMRYICRRAAEGASRSSRKPLDTVPHRIAWANSVYQTAFIWPPTRTRRTRARPSLILASLVLPASGHPRPSLVRQQQLDPRTIRRPTSQSTRLSCSLRSTPTSGRYTLATSTDLRCNCTMCWEIRRTKTAVSYFGAAQTHGVCEG